MFVLACVVLCLDFFKVRLGTGLLCRKLELDLALPCHV